ncbi:MAG: ribosome biogenesis GTPase Der [Candidatus Eremiobacteraeota bacterium]|nr:ribosome biogenesis GTPase Der [Candidatus Eremiobacteraeota bacterium]
MSAPTAARARPAIVAVVGRPNVGKSALFNRLAGKRLAIVEDTPGVTRDRLYALTDWRGRTFSLVDTAGIDPAAEHTDDMARRTRAQAQIAAGEADVIIFVVDASAGLSALDDDVVAIMRRTRRPVILVANKAESDRVKTQIPGEFARLGLGEPIVVSALHGEGTGDLLDAIVERLPPEDALPPADDELALAIVGRPNVGKSSLLNALLGEERTIVSHAPGTTRDAIDTIFPFHEHRIRLIDTAGVWRKTKHHGAIDYYASLRSLGAIARSDIAILVIDTMAGILDQDRRLAGIVLEERKGLVIVANKWDLALQQDGEFSQGELATIIHEAMPFAAFAPVTFLSALTGRRLGSLMPLVMRVAANLERRVPTPQLNALVRDAVYTHPAPLRGGKPLRIYYAAQVATHPPLFIFHCNDPDLVSPSYARFIENTLRAQFDFEGVPLGLEFRPRRDEDVEAHGQR